MAAPRHYLYAVRPGDSIDSIVRDLFGSSPRTLRYGQIRNQLLGLNRHLSDPDRPRAGDLMCLANPGPSLPPPGPRHVLSAAPTPAARQALWAMAWAEHSNLLTIPGGIALGAGSNLMSPGNLDLLRQIGDEYAAYKNSGGRITKGQYDYRRQQLIARFRQNVGPVERWLFGGATTPEAIRIARRGGIPYDRHIRHHVGRLARLGSLASKGGIVLTGVGVGAACIQIASTVDRNEKNEIFVDTVASTTVGIVVGLFVVSNPIGWGAALVFAIGGAVASYAAGKGAAFAYDGYGNEIDFVKGLGVDRVCR